MPQFRDYPQTTTLQATDAFLLDRIGAGTLYVDYADFAAALAGGLEVKQDGSVVDAKATVLDVLGPQLIATDETPGSVSLGLRFYGIIRGYSD